MTPTELENVERFRAGIFGGSIMAVAATDYDALLATYRALEISRDVTLRLLHGAQHGNIHSPEDLCAENCPECGQLRDGTHWRFFTEARGRKELVTE